VTHVATFGTLVDGDTIGVIFSFSGDNGAGTGDVSGPASATDSAIALFDGADGKTLKDSTYTITAAGAALLDDATAADQRTTLGAAASGSNSDITALTGLTTDLSVAQGGTGASTHTANSVLVGAGTSAITSVAPSTSGNVLTSNGTSWTSAAAGGIFSAEYISTGQTFTADSVLTLAHSLGARPSVVELWLKCGTADKGYAIGDFISYPQDTAGIDAGFVLQVDGTNIELITGSNIRALDQSTFNEVSLTTSSWTIYVVAYLGGTVS